MMRKSSRFLVLTLVVLVLTLSAGVLVGCGGSTAQVAAPTSSPATPTISAPVIERVAPEKALEIIREHKGDPNFVVLDVRTPQEYQSGHIKGAINVDFYASDFPKQLDKLDRNKTYVVYCRSGNRSGQTVSLMRRLGFTHIYDVQGGLSTWVRQGLPLNP